MERRIVPFVLTPRRALLVIATVTVLAVGLAMPAGSAPIGTWSPTSWTDGTGVVEFPGVVGLGPGAATTDATGTQVFGGSSLWLGTDTPFGAEFGSTQGEPYAQIGLAPGNQPSTTTVTFPSPSPGSGWGFAVGDIDADVLTISADGPDGPLPTSAIGFESTFNLCSNVPKPSACGSPTPTDVPTWDPLTGTLTGSGADTVGASAWFTPGEGVTSLTFTFSLQTGIPSFNLWFAVNTTSLSGQIGPLECFPLEGQVVYLTLPDGTMVLDGSGGPVTAVADAQGRWEFPSVVDGGLTTFGPVVPAIGCRPVTPTTATPPPEVAPAFTG